MSRKCRKITMIVAIILWFAWAAVHLVVADTPALLADGLRAAATVATLAWVVSLAVRPVAETVAVWRQIGRWEERQRPCGRCGELAADD